MHGIFCVMQEHPQTAEVEEGCSPASPMSSQEEYFEALEAPAALSGGLPLPKLKHSVLRKRR